MKALRERDHRLKLQQCAAVMEMITWLSEPQISLTLLHLDPTAGERKSLTLFKGVCGGSGKGHVQRNNVIRVFHRKLCVLLFCCCCVFPNVGGGSFYFQLLLMCFGNFDFLRGSVHIK